ncbi:MULTISPECIES: hypothetical protein [unclassified Embleya]|uniref:hypothetical protein n=1 Tax=unclassified Embleya TaxID=2699296 RepID=UPI0033D6AFF5
MTLTWTVTPGAETKFADHKWLHDSRHHFRFTVPPGTNAIDPATVSVDEWTNSSTTPFTHADCTELRKEVRSRSLKPKASLLEAVLPLVLKIPDGWSWHPGKDHAQLGITWPTPGAQLLRAVQLLIALRATVEARSDLGRLLNATGTSVVATSGAKPERLDFDWNAALLEGRAAVNEFLENAMPIVEKPPSHSVSSTTLNELLIARMFAADPKGLGRLLELGFVTPDGMDGHPFKDAVKGYKLDAPCASAVHQAYNHLRFVLYLEWRALHELCQR